MTDGVEAELESLRRFFLLSYHAEVARRHAPVRGAFPLVGGSRLDLVILNGGARVHFLYRSHAATENLVVVHDLSAALGSCSREEEFAFVRRAVGASDPLVHFVVEPPFLDRFDDVEGEAVAAVERHAGLWDGDLSRN